MNKTIITLCAVALLTLPYANTLYSADNQVVTTTMETTNVVAQTPFVAAAPVWPECLETEKNLTVGFRAVVDRPSGNKATLRLTGHTLYRIYLNGEFIGHGPARGPHDYYRVDEWNLNGKFKKGKNILAIEVAGYNVNSYYLLDRPSFVQAELVTPKNKVLASTGNQGVPFEAEILQNRVQKVQRYSFQRTFSEVYNLTPQFNDWVTDPLYKMHPATNAVQPPKQYLPRRVAYTHFTTFYPTVLLSSGTLKTGLQPQNVWKDRSLTGVSDKFKGFPESELTTIPSLELQTVANDNVEELSIAWDTIDSKLDMKMDDFRILDFGTNSTGFIGATVEVNKKAKLAFTFDEVMRGNDVDFTRLGCVNAIEYVLEPGTYFLESFEPYTFRYLKAMLLEGDCSVSQIYLREYANDEVWKAKFKCSDDRINKIYEAARHTFRQNAVDIFMDCPSRERAGWLCDSFFTSRIEYDLTGKSLIEKSFMENFCLPKKFEYLPEGMVAMCYPGDHNDGVFIPNWNMWLVSELAEYVQRTGDKEMVEDMKPRVLGIVNYLEQFKNSDGLLEKLPSWVFVEWSRANSLVQDVNYPSNMHFTGILDIAAKLYNLPELAAEAATMRETIRKQSWTGKFFADNAVRKDGRLESSKEATEVCQYYAFFFNVADPQSYPELWDTLVKDFGPQRNKTQKYPEVGMANQFIGNVMRLELLSRYGGNLKQIMDESVDYLLYMADKTGTLWENNGDYASCNHGFASHEIRVLYRDLLGVSKVDMLGKRVKLNISDDHANIPLEWCEGTLPTPDGDINVKWVKKEGKIQVSADLPSGWYIEESK